MNKLKYGIILTAIFFANTAFAEQPSTFYNVVTGSVINVEQINTGERKVLTPVQTCSIVDVPIYGSTGKAQTGEVLGGAIIGGILGNQVGGGKGKDAATILGAILGADFANKKGGQQTIVGYKQVEQCEIVNKVTYVKNNPTCNVTVELPSSLMNVQHSFRTGKCPALGEEYSIHTKLTIKLN